LVSDEEMEARRKKWTAPPYKANQGALYKVCGLKRLEGKKTSNNFMRVSIHFNPYLDTLLSGPLIFSCYNLFFLVVGTFILSQIF